MSRGARAVARLLAGAPATSVNLDDLDAFRQVLHRSEIGLVLTNRTILGVPAL